MIRGLYKQPGGKLVGDVRPLFDKDRYCDMVRTAQKYIYEGDIFQVVLSNRLEAPFEGSLLNTYRILRTLNPSPYKIGRAPRLNSSH